MTANFRAGAALALVSAPAVLLAGPPIGIDDPGILDPGQVELIIAGTTERRDSGDNYELPVVDFSYGISENVQMSAVLLRAVADPDGGSRRSGIGNGEVGLKWRFYQEGPLQVSVGALYEWELAESSVRRGVVDPANAWTIPVDFEREFDGWRLNGEVAYTVARGDEDGWGYGLAVARPAGERSEILLEAYGGADSEFEGHSTGVRVGLDTEIAPDMHLLIGVGTGLREESNDELDLDVFLGLQFFR